MLFQGMLIGIIILYIVTSFFYLGTVKQRKFKEITREQAVARYKVIICVYLIPMIPLLIKYFITSHT